MAPLAVDIKVTGNTCLQHPSHAELSRRKCIVQLGVAVHQKTKVLIVAVLHEILDHQNSVFDLPFAWG